MLNKYKDKYGFEGESLSDKVKLLNKMVLAFPTGDRRTYFENNLAFIEISVVIHVIHIARFLNKNARLVLTEESRTKYSTSLNVNDEIIKMEKTLGYFDTWRASSMQQKGKKKDWWCVNVFHLSPHLII